MTMSRYHRVESFQGLMGNVGEGSQLVVRLCRQLKCCSKKSHGTRLEKAGCCTALEGKDKHWQHGLKINKTSGKLLEKAQRLSA